MIAAAIDGKPIVPATPALVGKSQVENKSIDTSGNPESAGSDTAAVDKTPPVNESKVRQPSIGNPGNEESPQSVSIVVDPSTPVTAAAIEGSPIVPATPVLAGKSQIEDKSTDTSGNPETAGSDTAVVDKTPPVNELKVGQPSNDNPGNEESPRTVSKVVDPSTPVTAAAIDGSPIVPATPALVGESQIENKSKDTSGNPESAGSDTAAVDKTPPVNEMKVGQPSNDNPGNEESPRTAIIGVDPSTPVTAAAIDGKPIVPGTPALVGESQIENKGTAPSGNPETAGSDTAAVDKIPSLGQLKVGQPSIEQDGLIYVSPSTVFVPQGTDGLLAAEKVEYSIGGWEDTLDTVPFSIVTPGKYRIEYQGIDKAGNKEPLRTMLVVVDPSLASGAEGKPDIDAAGGRKREFRFAAKPAAALPVAVSTPAAHENKAALPMAEGAKPLVGLTTDPIYPDENPAPVINSGIAANPYAGLTRENHVSTFEYVTLGIVNVILIIGVMLL